MSSHTRLAIAEFFARGMSPVLMVTIVFAFGYLLVGVPVYFRRGAVSRDILGTCGGLFAAVIYLTFLFGFYPDLHKPTNNVQVIRAAAKVR